MENQPKIAQIIEQVRGLGKKELADFTDQLPHSLASDDDKKQLAASSLNATEDSTKVAVITDSVNKLSVDDKQAIIASVQLPPPTDAVRDKIWIAVVWAFIILVIGSFLVLAASLFLCNSMNIRSEHVQIIVTVFTASSAFLTGLLAPSPIGTKSTT